VRREEWRCEGVRDFNRSLVLGCSRCQELSQPAREKSTLLFSPLPPVQLFLTCTEFPATGAGCKREFSASNRDD